MTAGGASRKPPGACTPPRQEVSLEKAASGTRPAPPGGRRTASTLASLRAEPQRPDLVRPLPLLHRRLPVSGARPRRPVGWDDPALGANYIVLLPVASVCSDSPRPQSWPRKLGCARMCFNAGFCAQAAGCPSSRPAPAEEARCWGRLLPHVFTVAFPCLRVCYCRVRVAVQSRHFRGTSCPS